MVEAGGQRIRGFRHGLDYAFIRWRQRASADAERLIGLEPDPSARPGRKPLGGSMSLYRAGLEFASFLPLGVAMPPSCDGAVRFRRCELRFQPALASRRDPRSNPRPQALDFKTYVRSLLFDSRAALPERQGRRNASRR